MIEKVKKNKVKTGLAATAFVGLVSWVLVSSLPSNSPWHEIASSQAKGTQHVGNVSTRCTWNVLNRVGDVKDKPNTFQMLANGHCDNETESNSYDFLFANGNRYNCSANPVVKSPWPQFDFMVVNCEAKQGVDERPIEVDTNYQLEVGTRLAHISWNCNYFENSQCVPLPRIDISEECKVLKVNVVNAGGILNSVSQGCDSLGGSSGSTVNLFYDKDGNEGGPVIALHNSEIKGPNHHIDGSGPENRSLHIRYVVDEILKQDPTIKIYHAYEENDLPEVSNPFNEGGQCKTFGGYIAEFFASLFS